MLGAISGWRLGPAVSCICVNGLLYDSTQQGVLISRCVTGVSLSRGTVQHAAFNPEHVDQLFFRLGTWSPSKGCLHGDSPVMASFVV